VKAAVRRVVAALASLAGAMASVPADAQEFFLYGTNGDKLYVSYRNRMGRKRSYMTTFEGIVPNLERRYKETDSDWSREKIEEYMSVRPCPECKGARLRPELPGRLGGAARSRRRSSSSRRPRPPKRSRITPSRKTGRSRPSGRCRAASTYAPSTRAPAKVRKSSASTRPSTGSEKR